MHAAYQNSIVCIYDKYFVELFMLFLQMNYMKKSRMSVHAETQITPSNSEWAINWLQGFPTQCVSF